MKIQLIEKYSAQKLDGFVFYLFVCFLYTNNEIGVTSSKLEADIRSSQKIKDDWTVDGSVSSTMAAYISYPQGLSDHSFSVYVNRPGLSFGYFFRGGGTLSGIQRGIVEFTVEGYNERAFISMNQQQVQQLEIDDGNTIQVVDIDRNKPLIWQERWLQNLDIPEKWRFIETGNQQQQGQ